MASWHPEKHETWTIFTSNLKRVFSVMVRVIGFHENNNSFNPSGITDLYNIYYINKWHNCTLIKFQIILLPFCYTCNTKLL